MKVMWIVLSCLCVMTLAAEQDLRCYTCDTRDRDTEGREDQSLQCKDDDFSPHPKMLSRCPGYYCAVLVLPPDPENLIGGDQTSETTKRFCSMMGPETCSIMREHLEEEGLALESCFTCNTDLCNGSTNKSGTANCFLSLCQPSSFSMIGWRFLAMAGAGLVCIEILLICVCLLIWCARQMLPSFLMTLKPSPPSVEKVQEIPLSHINLGRSTSRLGPTTSILSRPSAINLGHFSVEFHRSCSQLRAISMDHTMRNSDTCH